MNATEIHAEKDLPSDPEKLRVYSWNVTLAYQQLLEKYRKLISSQFGKSSEKLTSQSDLDALQLEMDELLGQIAAVQDIEPEKEEETIEIPAHSRRRKKHGRNSIPAELITDVKIDLSDEEKKCSYCGGELHQFDTKEHIVVERTPAKYSATRYLMPVYGCSCCKNGVTSKEMPMVTPISKGLAGISLLTFVLVSKYNTIYLFTGYKDRFFTKAGSGLPDQHSVPGLISVAECWKGYIKDSLNNTGLQK